MSKGPLGRDRFVPELALFDTEDERREVYRDFWRERWGRWGFVLYCVASVMAVAGLSLTTSILFVIIDKFLNRRGFTFPEWVRPCVGAAGMMLCMLTVGAWSTYLARRRLRRYCRQRLVTKGVPICIECGYDLRGQVEPRCPECGKEFDPGLLAPGGGSQDSHPADRPRTEG